MISGNKLYGIYQDLENTALILFPSCIKIFSNLDLVRYFLNRKNVR